MKTAVLEGARLKFTLLLIRLGLMEPGKVMYIGGSDTLPPPLSREEEAELLGRLEEDAVRS